MKALRKIFAICTFVVMLLFGSPNVAHASANGLPPGFLVGDDTGFQAGTDGKYMLVNNDITPGGSFTRTITLSNYSTDDGEFSIHLVMNPEDPEHKPEISGKVDLLNAINVKLTYQEDVIYEGKISGEGTPVANSKANPLSLGTLEIGEARTIEAEFTVSDAYPDEAWQEVNSVDFYWLFYASRKEAATPTTPTTPPATSSSTLPTTGGKTPLGGKLPQTGEDWRNVLIGMIAGLVIVMIILVFAKKRREKQTNS